MSDASTDTTTLQDSCSGSHDDDKGAHNAIPAFHQNQVQHEMKADPWTLEHPKQAKEVSVEEELAYERFLEMIKHLNTCGFAAEMVKCKVITCTDTHFNGWGH